MRVVPPSEFDPNKPPIKEGFEYMEVKRIVGKFNRAITHNSFHPHSNEKMKFIDINRDPLRLHGPSVTEAISRIQAVGWNAGYTLTNFGIQAIVIHL